MDDFDSPTGELEYFFNTLWGDIPGYVYTPTRDIKTDTWKKVFFKWPEHKDAIISTTLARSAQGLDVFCAPAIFNKPEPVKEAVKGTFVLWAEFDGNAPREWGDPVEAPESHADALDPAPALPDQPDLVEPHGPSSRLWRGVPEPTLRVQSSNEGNEHVYWKLRDFCTDVREFETRNRSIAYTLRSDISGWDCNQILRPPGTVNYKKNRPVTVLRKHLRSYGEQGDATKDYELLTFRSIPKAEQVISRTLDTENLPAIERVVAKYPWDDAHYTLFVDSSIPTGNRSDALMRLAYFGAEVGMSDEEIYSVVDNADSRWKKYTERSDRKRRLLDIVNRAKLKYPGGYESIEFKGLAELPVEDVDNPFLYGFNDFVNSSINTEWVVEDLIERGGFGLLASKPGIGKTQMSLQLAISSALGRPFLRWKIPTPQKVLFLSLEMSHPSLKKFVSAMATPYSDADRELLQKNLIILPLGEPIMLDTPQGMRFMESIVNEVKPDGLIIDNVGKLSAGSLNDDNIARGLNNRYIELRKKRGCWIWFIHHNRKETSDNKKPTDLSDVYGSQYITAEVTTCFILWRKPGNKTIECIPVKNRLSEDIAPFRVKRDSSLHFTITEDEEDSAIIKSMKKEVEDLDTEPSPFDFE